MKSKTLKALCALGLYVYNLQRFCYTFNLALQKTFFFSEMLLHMQCTDSFYLCLKRQLLINYSNQLQNTLGQLD